MIFCPALSFAGIRAPLTRCDSSCLQAIATLSCEARAAVAVLVNLSSDERLSSAESLRSLEAHVSRLGNNLDEHTRRQAIKVDTQTVDRAMSLLNDLQDARRKMASYQDAAFRSMEIAYIEAQKQYGQAMDDLHNKLLIQQANYTALRSDMQRAALESLMEVRREALDKAFARGHGGQDGKLNRLLDLESELSASQAEVLEMQRSNVKTQTWFKMRSHAFQTVCMREVIDARERVERMEVQMWEEREKNERLIGHLSSQLQATQNDLEVSNAALSRADASLGQALARNKQLNQWKVTEAPKSEALKLEIESLRNGREGQERLMQLQAQERLRLSQSKQMQSPPVPSYSLTSPVAKGGGAVKVTSSPTNGAKSSPRPTPGTGVGTGGLPKQEQDEVAALRSQLSELRLELKEERSTREDLVRKMGLGLGLGAESSTGSLSLGLKGTGVGKVGSAAALIEDLRSERDALKQAMAAVKLASPDLYHALGLGSLR